MPEYPNRIRALRKAQGLSLEKVALDVGCSIPHLADMEKGESVLTTNWMVKIAAALEVKPSELLLLDQQVLPLDDDARRLVRLFERADESTRRKLLQMAELLVGDEEPARRRA